MSQSRVSDYKPTLHAVLNHRQGDLSKSDNIAVLLSWESDFSSPGRGGNKDRNVEKVKVN